MLFCNKCNVNIRGSKAECPLCGSPLIGTPEDPAFPVLPPHKHTLRSVFKVIVFAFLVLMIVMFAIIIFADVQYRGLIHTALTRAENPIAEEIYITKAFNTLYRHIITLLVSCGLIALMPVYRKWLRKINTSIGVEDYGKLNEIDISGEVLVKLGYSN